MRKFRRLPWLACLLATTLAGCSAHSPLGYYGQAAAGQAQLLAAARPIAQLLQDSAQPAPLRQRLARTQQMRRFASQQLHLPDNASYRRYADLGRRYAVWNVVAAPADALELHRWCYPVLGCVGYRGYFAEADAQAQAALLRQQGLDVHVYGVPAYSTLGWLNWLGGDPLLNTFIGWSEPELAGLIFHELAHQLLYVADDTAFNESFATAVQRLGTRQWLAAEGTPALQTALAATEQRRQQWQQLTRTTRAALAQLYAPLRSPGDGNAAPHAQPGRDMPDISARKQTILADFRQRYAMLRQGWVAAWQAMPPEPTTATPAPAATAPSLPTPAQPPAPTGAATPVAPAPNPWAPTDAWVAQANNASFATLGLYEDWAPAFIAMHQQAGGNWPRFYDAVRALAAQPQPARHAALCALLPLDSPHPDCVRHPD